MFWETWYATVADWLSIELWKWRLELNFDLIYVEMISIDWRFPNQIILLHIFYLLNNILCLTFWKIYIFKIVKDALEYSRFNTTVQCVLFVWGVKYPHDLNREKISFSNQQKCWCLISCASLMLKIQLWNFAHFLIIVPTIMCGAYLVKIQ